MTNIIALAPPAPQFWGEKSKLSGHFFSGLATLHIQVGLFLNTLHYPPQSPLIKGGRIWTGSLPFIGGGLGWGSAESSSLDSSVILGLCIHRSDSGEF
jgi:hypothetical protein